MKKLYGLVTLAFLATPVQQIWAEDPGQTSLEDGYGAIRKVVQLENDSWEAKIEAQKVEAEQLRKKNAAEISMIVRTCGNVLGFWTVDDIRVPGYPHAPLRLYNSFKAFKPEIRILNKREEEKRNRVPLLTLSDFTNRPDLWTLLEDNDLISRILAVLKKGITIDSEGKCVYRNP